MWILSTYDSDEIDERVVKVANSLNDIVTPIEDDTLILEIKEYFNQLKNQPSSNDEQVFHYRGKLYKIFYIDL